MTAYRGHFSIDGYLLFEAGLVVDFNDVGYRFTDGQEVDVVGQAARRNEILRLAPGYSLVMKRYLESRHQKTYLSYVLADSIVFDPSVAVENVEVRPKTDSGSRPLCGYLLDFREGRRRLKLA